MAGLLHRIGAPVARLWRRQPLEIPERTHAKYFFGETRFSVYQPSSKAWRLTRSDAGEYLAKLYADERMQPRMDIFLRCALPIYSSMAQRHNYWHVLRFSSVMPERYKTALRDAAALNPVLVLDEQGEDGSSAESDKVLLRILGKQESGIVAKFRVDDDDLLASDYLDQLDPYTRRPFKGMAVSFGHGAGAVYSDCHFSNFRDLHMHFPSMGQAVIGSWDARSRKLDVPRFPHHVRPARTMPTVVDSRKIAYLRTYHELQDIRVEALTGKVDEGLNKRRKPSSLKQLVRAFPTIEADLRADLTTAEVIVEKGRAQAANVTSELRSRKEP